MSSVKKFALSQAPFSNIATISENTNGKPVARHYSCNSIVQFCSFTLFDVLCVRVFCVLHLSSELCAAVRFLPVFAIYL